MRGLLDLLRAPKGDVLGINRRNVSFVQARNARRDFPLADDKLLAKEVLSAAGVPVSPTLATFRHFYEIREFAQRIEGLSEFVLKPAQGSGGNGIVVIAGREGDRFRTAGGRSLTFDELHRHVHDIVYGVYALDHSDVAIVEPRLRPSPFFADLFASGLSDVRIVAVDDVAVMAMLRVPTRASDGRANLHQGALGLAVEIDSGTVTRAWSRGAVIDRHPDTGGPLTGLVVPQWPRILDIGRAVANAVPLKYLGIDIVVDRTLGPLVLEINARPGLEIQNVNGVPLRRRLRERGVAE